MTSECMNCLSGIEPTIAEVGAIADLLDSLSVAAESVNIKRGELALIADRLRPGERAAGCLGERAGGATVAGAVRDGGQPYREAAMSAEVVSLPRVPDPPLELQAELQALVRLSRMVREQQRPTEKPPAQRVSAAEQRERMRPVIDYADALGVNLRAAGGDAGTDQGQAAG